MRSNWANYVKKSYNIHSVWNIMKWMCIGHYNPTGALRRNKENIERLPEEHEEIKQGECVESETYYWHKMLQEDFIPIERFSNSSSELSIEFGDEWGNAFLLGTQLDDIICAKGLSAVLVGIKYRFQHQFAILIIIVYTYVLFNINI
ncbi:uncharacterized protein [Eurosta solidaginis]|uniref:uncharacterized protein n=1 Tax=Eurosta solidaginis TaxID=178769 RepID=UPI0035305A92